MERWGINLILTFQQLSPGLDGVMAFLSFLGREEFFLLVISFLYWCVDARWGVQALGMLLLSSFTNDLLKWAFHAPRPYWIDTQVKALSAETSYGIPSGHAQTGTSFWGFNAATLNKTWAWTGAVFLVLGISLSRIYLGVHFPHDVVTGWLIGVALLAIYLWIVPCAAAWLKPKSLGFQIGAAIALSAIMLGLVLGVRAAIAGVVDPPAWEARAAVASPPRPGQPATDPRSLDGSMVILGVISGAGAGLALARRYTPFDARGPWPKRIGRLALGLIVLLGLRIGLAAIFPHEPLAVAMLFRYIRYVVLGLWAIWLAPWVFVRLGLAEPNGR